MQELPFTKSPATIYLIGLPGIGKLTIAKEIAKHGYKLVDNHLINNLILSLRTSDGVSKPSKEPWTQIQIRKIREVVLDFIKKDSSSNHVFTNVLLEGEERLYNQIKDVAVIRGAIFIPIKLTISEEEHCKRIKSPGRKELYKTTDLPASDTKLLNIEHQNLLELDLSNLTAQEAATKILEHANKILSSPKPNSDENPKTQIIIEEEENSVITNIIRDGVLDYNIPYIGQYDTKAFNIHFRDQADHIIAGVFGNFVEDYIRIDYVWVSSNHRKKGLGTKLMQELDKLASNKKVRYMRLFTLDFQAKPFYEKMGYRVLAAIPDWNHSHTCYIMRKELVVS